MSRKALTNLCSIILLALMFPALWIYNQRINYKKVLTLDTKFSLNTAPVLAQQLSSTTYIMQNLKTADTNLAPILQADVLNTPLFGVMGRAITTTAGTIEVYEYESPKAAKKQLVAFKTDPTLPADLKNNLFTYKNLIIYNKSFSPKITEIFGGLTNE